MRTWWNFFDGVHKFPPKMIWIERSLFWLHINVFAAQKVDLKFKTQTTDL